MTVSKLLTMLACVTFQNRGASYPVWRDHWVKTFLGEHGKTQEWFDSKQRVYEIAALEFDTLMRASEELWELHNNGCTPEQWKEATERLGEDCPDAVTEVAHDIGRFIRHYFPESEFKAQYDYNYEGWAECYGEEGNDTEYWSARERDMESMKPCPADQLPGTV